MGSVHRVALAVAVVAGCGTTLPPLPTDGPSRRKPSGGAAAVARTEPDFAAADRLRAEVFLDSEGKEILKGVRILVPALDAAAGTARFGVYNATGVDLPDLSVSVVFAMPGFTSGDTPPARLEIVEVPLAAGESRDLTVASGSRGAAAPVAFQVHAGSAAVLTAGGEDGQGTTFLGGRLECTGLETNLTDATPSLKVALAPTAEGAGGLPPLETRLYLVRGGTAVWSGRWVVLPAPREGDGGTRRLRWDLPSEPSLAGCTPHLRVRETR